MDRSYPVVILVALCLTACGTTTEPVDASADATENDVASDLDAQAADVIEEWRLCSWDGALWAPPEGGVGHYYSCCAGMICYGECVTDGGAPRCDCGGIIGGCDNPSRCCGDLYADVLLLACGQQCVFTGH